MEIIVDECLHKSTITVLEEYGFKTRTIESILRWGAEDEEIYDYASTKNIPIITHDRGFGRIYFESREKPSMIIVLHLESPHPEKTNLLLKKAFKKLDLLSKNYNHKLIIISARKIRIRTKK